MFLRLPRRKSSWWCSCTGPSLLFSLSLLLRDQPAAGPKPGPGSVLERQETGNKEPQYYQQRQAIFVQNEAIDPPSRPNEPSHRIFRVTVPADTRGQLDASYRTEATAIVNVRHRFARDAGEIPRSQLPAVRPRHLDAEGNLRRVRVLSLDGGGVRGTAEAMILIEI
eukprot:COSAG04_NODE_7794_length_1066_cov_1.214064_2_plen_166_part_01